MTRIAQNFTTRGTHFDHPISDLYNCFTDPQLTLGFAIGCASSIRLGRRHRAGAMARHLAVMVVVISAVTDGFAPVSIKTAAALHVDWRPRRWQRSPAHAASPQDVASVGTQVTLSDNLILTVHEVSSAGATFSVSGADGGGKTWQSSISAATYIVRQLGMFPHLMDGQRVLEIGAGTGLCSLAIASLSAERQREGHLGRSRKAPRAPAIKTQVIASDIDPVTVELVQRSARDMDLSIEGLQFDLCDASNHLPSYDWLIAADMLYSNDLALSVADFCAQALDGGARVLIADPGREPRKTFLQRLQLRTGIRGKFQTDPQLDADRLVLLHTQPAHNLSPFSCSSHLEAVSDEFSGEDFPLTAEEAEEKLYQFELFSN